MHGIRLRDNRFGDSALAFTREGGENGFISQDPRNEGLNGQENSDPERAVLEKFQGLSLDKLAEKSNGSLPNRHRPQFFTYFSHFRLDFRGCLWYHQATTAKGQHA